MPYGLREDAHLQPIVARLREVEEDFMNYTDSQRAQRICAAVTAELTALAVPVPTLEIGNYPGLNGQFLFTTWTLRVNAGLARIQLMERANTSRKKQIFAQLGDTLTHEARHCEQWWRMALLVVTKKWNKDRIKPTALQLNGTLGISMAICQRALTAQLLNTPLMQETEPWFDSVYGGGSSFREINVMGRNLRPSGPTRVGGGQENVGQLFQTTEFVRYEQGLAEEADAHATGRRVQELYLQGTGVAPAPLAGHQRPSGTF